MKISKDSSNGSTAFKLLDRNNCFAVVAAAVKDVVPDSVVDLKSPEVKNLLTLFTHWKSYFILTLLLSFLVLYSNLQLSVLVELLPISGLPNGSLVVAVSVLPQNLVSSKPRLCIKSLVSDTKLRGQKP